MLSNLLNDVRYGLRGFARRPAFAAVIVATLALAIGLNVAVFSLYDQLLLRRLPVAEPDRLVNFVSSGPRPRNVMCGSAQGDCDRTFSYPMVRDLERAIALGDGPLAGVAATQLASTNLGYERRTAGAQVLFVSGRYFELLGLLPERGRLLGPQDEGAPGSAAVAVLGYDYWRNTLGAPADVVGKTLSVRGRPLEIVGVAPRGFAGTTPGDRAQAFVPITFDWLAVGTARPVHEDRFAYWAYVFGRLRPGATREEAEVAINVPYRAAVTDEARSVPDLAGDEIDRFRSRSIELVPGAQGQGSAPGIARTPLAVFFAATGTILLIASLNLANLMLARGAARVGEMAVRASLGAGWRRLAGLLGTEALLLAALAALLSLPVALGALRAAAAWMPPFTINAPDVSLHWRAVGAAFGIAGLAAVVFALVPLLKLAFTDPGPALQAAGRSFGGKAAGRFRFLLSTSQIALSMLLLVLAALFTQSLANVARVDLGMRTESVVAFTVSPGLSGYAPERAAQTFDRFEQALAAQPGVDAVTSSMISLLSGSSWGGRLAVEGFDPAGLSGADAFVYTNYVGADFLRTLGVPLLLGRDIGDADTAGAPKVAIVNETFARRFGLGDNPIGKRVGMSYDAPLDIEIVGLFKDAAYDAVKDSSPPQVVMPRRQAGAAPFVSMAFYARASQAPETLLAAIPGLVAGIDPDLPAADVRTLESQARENVRTDWLLMTLAGSLAAAATLLAALGLYGVLSYAVAQRTREIGVRLAFGAEPARVRGMVLKQVAWMAAVGLSAGLAAALLLGRLAQALLFGLAPTEPAAFGAAAALLTAVVLGASYWPARRASRVDPVVALRGE